MTETHDNLLERPEFFPVDIDVKNEAFIFKETCVEDLAQMAFHDMRSFTGDAYRLSFRTVRAHFDHGSTLRPAPRYIFHTAFCGSTLLARALEFPARFFSYREPACLTRLAHLHSWRDVSPELRTEVLHWTNQMLCRGVLASEATIVKAHNICSNLLPELFDHKLLYPAGRALLLYSKPDDFIVAVLKHADRRTWARKTFEAFGIQAVRGMPVNLDSKNDAQIAALLWAWHIEQCRRAEAVTGVTLATLRDRCFYAQPAASLLRVSELLALDLTAEECEARARGDVFCHDSKGGERFSRAQRDREQAIERRAFDAEIGAAIDWLASTALCDLLQWPDRRHLSVPDLDGTSPTANTAQIT